MQPYDTTAKSKAIEHATQVFNKHRGGLSAPEIALLRRVYLRDWGTAMAAQALLVLSYAAMSGKVCLRPPQRSAA